MVINLDGQNGGLIVNYAHIYIQETLISDWQHGEISYIGLIHKIIQVRHNNYGTYNNLDGQNIIQYQLMEDI